MRVQLNARDGELDLWEEAIKKAVDIEAKALLQPSSKTREIDLKYSWEYKPAKKEEKDFGKIKSTNTPPIDVSSGKHPQFFTHQSQTSKKNQDRQEGSWRCGGRKQGRSHDFLTTNINANIIKKERKDIF